MSIFDIVAIAALLLVLTIALDTVADDDDECNPPFSANPDYEYISHDDVRYVFGATVSDKLKDGEWHE